MVVLGGLRSGDVEYVSLFAPFKLRGVCYPFVHQKEI
jgi:hypothetical protein